MRFGQKKFMFILIDMDWGNLHLEKYYVWMNEVKDSHNEGREENNCVMVMEKRKEGECHAPSQNTEK